MPCDPMALRRTTTPFTLQAGFKHADSEPAHSSRRVAVGAEAERLAGHDAVEEPLWPHHHHACGHTPVIHQVVKGKIREINRYLRAGAQPRYPLPLPLVLALALPLALPAAREVARPGAELTQTAAPG